MCEEAHTTHPKSASNSQHIPQDASPDMRLLGVTQYDSPTLATEKISILWSLTEATQYSLGLELASDTQ